MFDRREHQLDAHEHEHRVLARQHAVDAGAEEERAEQEELVEQHQSRLASTTAPIERAEQQHADDLERDDVDAEDRVGDLRRAHRRVEVDLVAVERVHEQAAEDAREEQRRRRRPASAGRCRATPRDASARA